LQKYICESGGVLDAFRRHDGHSHLEESGIQNLEDEINTDFNIKNWDVQKKSCHVHVANLTNFTERN